MENQTAQMRVTDETSRRITSLRFLLIAFVVFIHANLKADDALDYYHLDFVQPAWIAWFKDFVCGTLGGAAVPLFFLFSAYLQFSKCNPYPALLKKRSRTASPAVHRLDAHNDCAVCRRAVNAADCAVFSE